MRPHVLEVTAFGAFPGDVRVDLDELGASGLVLLCGDTGGGKTTLLDALGFALYGVVPGERQKAREDLRSHHAAPGSRAQVRLELTARGRRLRLTRTPAQHRPKKRGEGTVLEHPTALLEQRSADGTWATVAARPEDVGLEVGRLLGMDADQFFQVVVLPQGRFAAFLQADHKDRERLLKQLFHVDRFESVERWLADRTAAAAAAVEAARAEVAGCVARVAQAAGAEVPDALDDASPWAAGLRAAAVLDAAAGAEAVVAAQLARAAAEAALAEAEALQAAQDARRQALAELASLEADDAAVADLASRLDQARRAAPVAVALRGMAEAEDERGSAAEAAARTAAEAAGPAPAALPAVGGGTGLGKETPPGGVAEVDGLAASDAGGWHALARAADIEAHRLDRWVDLEHRALAADEEAAAAGAAAEGLEEQLAGCREWLEALPGLRAERQRDVDVARAAAAELPALRLQRKAAEEQRALADQLAALEAAQPQLLDAVAAAAREADEARREADRLRNERVDALIAELAFRLEDDCPCPVCGSLAHPDVPEVQPGGPIGREAEDAAQSSAEQARTQEGEARRALAVLEERAAGLRARLQPVDPVSGGVTVDVAGDVADGYPDRLADRLDDRLDDHLEDRLAAAEAVAGGLAAAEELLVLLAAEGEQRYAELARTETRLEEERKRADEATGRARELRSELRAAGLEHAVHVDVLLARRDAAAARAAACDLAGAAAGRLAAAEATLLRAATTVDRLLGEAGFSDAGAALAAVLDEPVLVAGTQRVTAHREALARVRARLEALQVDDERPPPVDALRGAAAAAAAEHESAVGSATVLASRSEALAALEPVLTASLDAMAPLRERWVLLRGLSELAAGRGDNRLSMPLSTFVLAARLEEVAQAASTRLSRMSGGRYTLRHTDGSRDRRSRAGLGLVVEDGWTGRTRDTATLSGGETFMTALSLALGLADVVTAEAGGHSIDALFVDEGFGTLDADSLDQVMDVLDDLRSGGRLVGLVSHVADLRQRIPAQIRVRKGVHGSTVETT